MRSRSFLRGPSWKTRGKPSKGTLVEWVPPRMIRRLVLEPLVVALGVVALLLAIPALALSALTDIWIRRSFPTTRLVAVALVHVVMEALGVVCRAGLWVICLPIGGVRRSRGQE